jgi:hypothetical protein
MSSKRFLLSTLVILSLFITVQLYAEEQSSSISDFVMEDQYEQRQEIDKITNLDMLFADDFNDFPNFEDDLYKINHHSTGRAFLYSLMLPGAGEIYTGSKLKAAFFLGIEVFSWYKYATSYGDGQDLKDQYRTFANENWSPADYRSYLIEVKGITNDTMVYDDTSTFTHHLPDFKTQQYFEMIGKYEQFVYGWADTDYATGDSLSDLRTSYLNIRDKSNSKFDTARNFAIVSIANRLISAFDAALSARKLNKRADRFSEIRVKARLADYHGEKIPKLVLTYNFF